MVREDVKTIPKHMNHSHENLYITVEEWGMDFKETRFYVIR